VAWQEFVFAGGNVILSVALLFSVTSPHKPATRTSLITALTIGSFAVAFATMQLWFSAAAAGTNAAMWAVLVVQSLRTQQASTSP
jgi:hypothetical protein